MVVFDKKTAMVKIHFHLKVKQMIDKKRIRNIDNYLIGIQDDEEFFVSICFNTLNKTKIQNTGLSIPPIIGEQILPKIVGPISRFNANGGFCKLKDKPKEICYREISVKDWHGNYHNVYIPYNRFRRKAIPPYGIEIKTIENNDNIYLVSPKLCRNEENCGLIKHVINLFLELFGSCEILNSTFLAPLSAIPTTRVNWKILPEGEYPWERIAEISGNIKSQSVGKARIQEQNINYVLKFKPQRLIYGAGGFRGYLIFEFPEKQLYVMENVIYGNATYIFENDWKQFSQLTKAEIINNRLQKERFEHRDDWESHINKLLK